MGFFRSDEEIAARKREKDEMKRREEIERKRKRDEKLDKSGLAIQEYSDDELDELIKEDMGIVLDDFPALSATLGLTLTGNVGGSENLRALRGLMRQNLILMRQNEQIIRELRKIVNKN